MPVIISKHTKQIRVNFTMLFLSIAGTNVEHNKQNKGDLGHLSLKYFNTLRMLDDFVILLQPF